MLCLGSIGTDRIISESCNKGTVLQRYQRKMSIKCSFSYNFFVKFHGKKNIGSQNMTVLQDFSYECVPKISFSYFSTKTYVVGTQKNRLIETVLLSTQNIC